MSGRVVYFMKVDETLSTQEYWEDERFLSKRPSRNRVRKHAVGDNIYHQDPDTKLWIQEDSVHSNEDGAPNEAHIIRDTNPPRVLVSRDFAYWGGSGPAIPANLRDAPGLGAWWKNRGYRSNFTAAFEASLVAWLRSVGDAGFVAPPLDWARR